MAITRQRTIIEAISPKVKTASIDIYYEFSEQMTKALNMSLVIPPIIVKFPIELKDIAKNIIKEAQLKDYGISAVLIQAESGMQIHTQIEYSLIAIDIFSCKPYSPETAKKVVESFFSPIIKQEKFENIT